MVTGEKSMNHRTRNLAFTLPILTGTRTRRRAAVALAALTLLAAEACSSNSPSSTAAETTQTATANSPPSEASSLQGEWDTGAYPSSRVRAAIIDAGLSSADAIEPSGGGKRFEFKLVFYEESGVPFVRAAGWDPSKYPEPPDADHGPYRLLQNDRIAITCDVCDLATQFMLFSYELSGNTLTLHYIRSVDPDRSAKELHDDAPFLIAWTVAPFHKMH